MSAMQPMLHRRRTWVRRSRRSSVGATLVFALISLVALTLAAVALIRSVDSGTLILGNLSFKQDAQAAADDAARTAIKWLSDNVAGTTLHDDSIRNGFRASLNVNLDPTGTSSSANRVLIDWDFNDCSGSGLPTAQCLKPSEMELRQLGGNVKARYLIVRLCEGPGNPNSLHCARAITPPPPGAGVGGFKGGSCLNYPNCYQTPSTTPGVYYRILVRAKGGRNTLSFTETLIHM